MTRCKEIPKISQCSDFHLPLGILVFRPHVGKKGDVRKFEKAWIDFGFIGVHIEADRRKL